MVSKLQKGWWMIGIKMSTMNPQFRRAFQNRLNNNNPIAVYYTIVEEGC